MAHPTGQSIEPCYSGSCPREKISRIVRRLLGPACVIFCLLALLCSMPAPARAGGPGGLNPSTICPPPGKAECGEPIGLPFGDVFEQVTDYTSAGQHPLVVTRYHTTYELYQGGSFGVWRWTYDRRLGISGSSVGVNRPDGRQIAFDADGSGGWTGITNLDLRLAQAGLTWTVTDWEDNVETYNSSGYLTSIKSRDGYTQTLSYDANNEVISVADSYGRGLTIAWTNGDISSITTPDGLVLNYTYNTNPSDLGYGDLVQVSYPSSPPTSQSYLYEDTTNHRVLTGIIDEDGNRFTTWTYDDTWPLTQSEPRALSSQHAGGADLTTLAYDNNFPSIPTVTKTLGLQEVFKTTSYQVSVNSSDPQYWTAVSEIDRLATATTAAAVSKVTYDSNGYVASQTDWNGNITKYTNDAHGDETSRTVAYGTAQAETIATTWHPTFHLPTQITEPTRVWSFTYDANGNLLTKTLTTAGGGAPRVTGNGFDKTPATSPGPTPGVKVNVFDKTVTASPSPSPVVKGSEVTKTLTPRGTWLYTNKSAGQERPVASSGTTSTWTYTYNSTGEVLTASDPRGNTTTYAYDAQGNLTSITNALGRVTTLSSYDANGRPRTIQDPNGLVTTLTYNFRGQVTSKTEGQWVTTYTYDAVGLLTKLTRPDGSFFAFTHDAAHRPIGVADALGDTIAFTLDAAGNPTSTQVFNPSNSLTTTRSYTYDAISRVLQEIGAQGQTTSYSYDANGNRLHITDPLSDVTSNAYDALDRLIQSTDANGGTAAFGYDLQNRVSSVTDPRGLTTSYAYDVLDDVTSNSSPDTGVTAKTYDAAGNLITATDARGDTTTYTYDALNRVTKAAFADSTSIVYQYDQDANGIGHLTAMTDAGGTTTWVYDIHGHVTLKQQTTGAVTLTTSKTYNAATGQLASIVYPSGATTFYSYDVTGRVSTITYKPSGGTTSSLLSQIDYQPFGPAASWTQGSGALYSRTFDQDGRIVGLALSSASATSESATTALAYDAASRIASIATGSRINGINVMGLVPQTFGYDALGRLTNYTNGTTTQTYAYDANGNRTSFTAPNVALTYTYAAASNRLLGISGSETDSFTYDANGNMLTHNSPAADYTYTYNARNRRTQAYVGGNATTDVINGLGQRTVQTVVSSELFFYDEAGHLTGSYNGNGSVIAETVWLGDLPVAALEPSGPFYIAPDHLGAPHQIADAAGNVGWLWNHDPFGNGVPGGTFSYDLRFPGQFYDQNAKLHYNYHRDYDPNSGRYIESDPIGFRGGINTYAYVGGNPVGAADLYGLDTTGVGVGGGYQIGPFSGNGSITYVCDKEGNTGVAVTVGGGLQGGAGAGASGGVTFSGSNAPTIGDLGGPFGYANGTGGAGLGGSAGGFAGSSSNGTPVVGGEATLGAGFGAGGGGGVTNTWVVPINTVPSNLNNSVLPGNIPTIIPPGSGLPQPSQNPWLYNGNMYKSGPHGPVKLCPCK
jgi:RHS repeat-associated protein